MNCIYSLQSGQLVISVPLSGVYNDVFYFPQVLCSSVEDEPRYDELLRAWIAEGVLPDFPNFSKENVRKKRKRKKMYEREASEAKKMKLDNDGDSSEFFCTFQLA